MALYAVIGLGQLGAAVATNLANGGEVIAIDTNAARVDAVKDHVARALCLDATDERALRASGISDASTVVLALGENQLEEAVLATMLLRDLGVGRIIARAGTDVQAKVLERLGVSKVIFPERQIGTQIARQILMPSVREIVPLADDASLAEVEAPEGFIGRSLAELKLRTEFGVNAVAVRRQVEAVQDDGTVKQADRVVSNVGPETILEKGDVLVVVGSDDAVRALSAAK
ncbi:MAG: TrkA family potassium uptake protein [Deltaproteobacteria bacterium]|nr:TrkA family potassium uptake protein [Deltaproteobacteria bacterium]